MLFMTNKVNKDNNILFSHHCGPRKPCTDCNRAGSYVYIHPGSPQGCLMNCSCNEMYGIMPLDIVALWIRTCKTPKDMQE